MINKKETEATVITAIMVSPTKLGQQPRCAIYVEDQLIFTGSSYDAGIKELHKALQLEFHILHMADGPEVFPSKMEDGFLDDYLYAEINTSDDEVQEDNVDEK